MSRSLIFSFNGTVYYKMGKHNTGLTSMIALFFEPLSFHNVIQVAITLQMSCCGNVVPTSTFPQSAGMEKVKCCHCYNLLDHIPKYAKGDPRNIALIGHWDGWQPFRTSGNHSCGMYIYFNL